MAGNKNIIPLYKTIDWKKLKIIIKETVAFINKKYSKNGIDLNKFNTNKIVCYRCEGIDLQGKNVELFGLKGRSCFVYDNSYEIFEIPLKFNDKKDEIFLVFAKNKSFEGQWIVTYMIIHHTIKNNKYYRKVIFSPLFDGAISYNHKSKHYIFNCEKRNCALNRDIMRTYTYFDDRGFRESQYGKTYAYYLNKKPQTELYKNYKKNKKRSMR